LSSTRREDYDSFNFTTLIHRNQEERAFIVQFVSSFTWELELIIQRESESESSEFGWPILAESKSQRHDPISTARKKKKKRLHK
jgi:hypothetical protein